MRATISAILCIFAITQIACPALAAEESLEQLVGTRIYSASKKEEDLYHSPSALYVITEQDLKQMGVRHVADALRTVPGLQVAKITSNKWMVASRGFGEQFSNKLLVLVDGRPVYNTLFSGALWDQQDIPIQDIKQIEVIRGPGATLWGSNAVNGVINIITKSSRDTLGNKATVTTGFTDGGENQTVLEGRHGSKLKDDATLRSTIKLREDPSYSAANNSRGYGDSWQAGSANFRYDSIPSKEKSVSVTGAVFATESDQTYTFPSLVGPPFSTRVRGEESSRGAYIQGEWTKTQSTTSSLTFRSYLDYTDWDYAGYNPHYVDGAAEAQYDYLLFENWETVSGAGYKFTYDTIDNSNFLIYNPESFDAHFLNAFFQTKIPLIEDVFATVGTKAESNTYDDFSLSPSVKLAWQPNPFFMSWASWSRAYRIPSRGTFHLTTIAAGTPGGYLALIPSEDFESESLDAYEAGIRINPLRGLHVDTAIFYNDYDKLRTFLPGPALGPPIGTPLYISNAGRAQNRGIEISATYQTTPDLRLSAGYSYHELDFEADPGVVDPVFLTSADKWPSQMWNAHLAYNVTEDVTFNLSGYYSSKMPAIAIPSYTKVDSNIAWAIRDDLEMLIGVDNLTDNAHPEYSAQLYGERTEVPRLYYITFKVGL